MPRNLSYYGDPISENIADREDTGYRICRNAVLARTGFQAYIAHELSDYIRNKLVDFGITLEDDDTIEFYRSPDEVFRTEFIASLEGMPLTDEHPEEMVDSDTHKDVCRGHAQNVRQGTEPLKSGDMPLLGDILITDAGAVKLHKAGRRELSCGYTYDIRQDGNRILQVDMVGNHVALVPKGRAGKEVGIMDAAPKEVQREPLNMSKLLTEIRKKGWLAWAKDAKPEEVADAAMELESASAKAKDAEEEHPEKCKCSDCAPTGKDAMALKAAKDAEAAAAKKKGEADDDEDGEVSDAEVKEALATLREALEQDEEDDDKGEGEDADEEDDEEDDEEGEAGDADIVAAVEPLDASERPKEIIATDSGIHILKVLRPIVARSKDKSLRAAFDTAAKLVNARAAKHGKGKDGYRKFTTASQRSSAEARDSASKPRENDEAQASKLDDLYAKFRGKTTGTVKS